MPYDFIYISPHLDDVTFSCGGQIYARTAAGATVLVVTVTTGLPPAPLSEFARELHERWQLPADGVRLRREEDEAACGKLGADFEHWPVPDCIYRRDPASGRPLYNTLDDIFDRPRRADEAIVPEIAGRLASLPQAGQVIAPLAVGQHVDHQLTRLACEQVFGGDLLYYEDYPYIRQEGALARAQGEAEQWQETLLPIDETATAAKIRGMAAYKSQIPIFFDDGHDLDKQARMQIRLTGGERVWRRLAGTPGINVAFLD